MVSDYFGEQEIGGLRFRFLVPFPKIRVAEIENVPY